VPNRWLGPLLTALIVGGVALVLWANWETTPTRSGAGRPAVQPPAPVLAGPLADFREYPIGEEVERNSLRVAAVWLPSVQVEGQVVTAGTDVIHLEADVHATAGNPNGLAKDEFVPYLQIAYEVVPAAGGAPLKGTLMPMVARDGLHYGATLRMPGPGSYRLTYAIQPPSANGLGRHTDPATGVAAWWEPFTTSFDWDYQPEVATESQAPAERR
jgi:periplasmic iron binding protein